MSKAHNGPLRLIAVAAVLLLSTISVLVGFRKLATLPSRGSGAPAHHGFLRYGRNCPCGRATKSALPSRGHLTTHIVSQRQLSQNALRAIRQTQKVQRMTSNAHTTMHALVRETVSATRSDADEPAVELELQPHLPSADRRPSSPTANRESHSLAKS
jgi:hypothetical protein